MLQVHLGKHKAHKAHCKWPFSPFAPSEPCRLRSSKDMGYLENHRCERQKFKKDCSSATHCCRRLAASGHDDFSLQSAKLDSLSSHLQLGRPRRRRGFVTKFSFQSSSGLQEAAKIGHLLVLVANKYKRSVQSCIGWSSIIVSNLSFIRRMLARQSSALLRGQPMIDLNIRLCVLSNLKNCRCVSGKVTKPNNTVGVTTASNIFNRRAMHTSLFNRTVWCWWNLPHAAWIRAAKSTALLCVTSPLSSLPKYLWVSPPVSTSTQAFPISTCWGTRSLLSVVNNFVFETLRCSTKWRDARWGTRGLCCKWRKRH